MRSHKKSAVSAGAFALTLSTLAAIPAAAAAADIAKGKEIAMDRAKGNCVACHFMLEGESPGNLGPALIAIQGRYDSKEKLHDQIYDATVVNPESAMPPFGKNRILSDEELENVVEYIWSL
jgi:sulfur-oxidizing protein SoxX